VRFRYFTLCERGVLVVSLLAVGFLLLDPFMLERARTLSPHTRAFFGAITDVGRSNWMLIPTAAVIAFAIVLRRNHLGFRNSAGYGLIISTAGYVFVSVAGAGLVATLLKNILGRARPKLYDVVGHFDFHFFSFNSDYVSIPSGHATSIFAFATVIAILWPRGRLLLYTLATWIAASRDSSAPTTSRTRCSAPFWASPSHISCATGSRPGDGCSNTRRMGATGFAGPGHRPGSAGRSRSGRLTTPRRAETPRGGNGLGQSGCAALERPHPGLTLYKPWENPHIQGRGAGPWSPWTSRFTSSSNLL